MGQQPAQEPGVGLHAQRHRPGERRAELAQGRGAVGAVGDDLGEHRVVQAADLGALGEPGVGAHAVTLWLAQPQHRAARGEEPARGVLRADPGLDRMPGQPDVVLGEGELLPGRDPQLPLHQVHAGDQLGDRVLHLETGVHLHEVVRVRIAAGHDELHRARAPVAAGAGRLDGRLPHRRPRLVVEEHAGRLLDDLLVAPLEGALALAEVDDIAVAVGQDLDLDVPGAVDPPLDQERVVAEGGRRLAPGRRDLLVQHGQVPDQPHALAAAARAGLEQHRGAQVPRRRGEFGVTSAGDDRDSGRLHGLLGADLVAHQGDRLGRRPDEDQARLGARPSEGGVLGEEPVPRVDGLGAGAGRRLQQPGHGQIRSVPPCRPPGRAGRRRRRRRRRRPSGCRGRAAYG